MAWFSSHTESSIVLLQQPAVKSREAKCVFRHSGVWTVTVLQSFNRQLRSKDNKFENVDYLEIYRDDLPCSRFPTIHKNLT